MANNENQLTEQNTNKSSEQEAQPANPVPKPEDIDVLSQKPQDNSKLLWSILSGIFILIAGMFLIEWLALLVLSAGSDYWQDLSSVDPVYLNVFSFISTVILLLIGAKKDLLKSLGGRVKPVRESIRTPKGTAVSLIACIGVVIIILIFQPILENFYFDKGEQFFNTETEIAERWYRKASIIDPVGDTLINTLQSLGNNPSSPQEIRVGVKALYRLGQIAQQIQTVTSDGRPTAIQYYEDILRQESCFIDVYYRLSGLYLRQMEYDSAQAKITKGIAMLHLIDAMPDNERNQCGLTTVESGSQSSFSRVTQWHYLALLQNAYGRYYITIAQNSDATPDIDLATTRLDQARVAIDVLRDLETELENLPPDDPNKDNLEILSPQIDEAEFLWHYWRVANEVVLERDDCDVFTMAWSFAEENFHPADLRGVQRERYEEIRLRSAQCSN